MPYEIAYNERKLVGWDPEVDFLLISEMGIFSWFEGKQIKFNPRPFSDDVREEEPRKKIVDLHFEITKQIDALIAANEEEAVFEEVKGTIPKKMEDLAEIRDPIQKEPQITRFEPEIKPEMSFRNQDIQKEFFDVDLPKEKLSDIKFVKAPEDTADFVVLKDKEDDLVKDEEFHSWMDSKVASATSKGLSHVNTPVKTSTQKTKLEKGSSLSEKAKKIAEYNGYTEYQKELEQTIKQIEEQKKALEKAEQEMMKKKLELEQKKLHSDEKKKEEEKLHKLELEKEKQRQKELKLKQIEKEKKKKEQEKLKKLELRKARKEAIIKEREQRKKAKAKAKQKKLEAKKALKEKQLKRKLSEKKKTAEKTGTFSNILRGDKETVKTAPAGMDKFIVSKEKAAEQNLLLDEDIKRVLTITDNLLGKLPEEVINDFVQSEEFALYERVISKYKIK